MNACVPARRFRAQRAHRPVGLRLWCLALALVQSSCALLACPPVADYNTNSPVLRGTYDPVELLQYGPASTSSCDAGSLEAPCAVHSVYVPGAARTPRLPLLVFLPGSSMTPDKHDLVLQMAAYAGYRTIGLSYDSRNNVEAGCVVDLLPPVCPTDCHRQWRDEIIQGTDQTADITVQPGDSILERLYALLARLYADDLADGTNDDSWDRYFTPTSGPPPQVTYANFVWANIIVAGFSQGAGHTARISKAVAVHGMVLFDGPADGCTDPAGTLVAVDWLNEPDTSAGRPRFGVMHANWFTIFGIPVGTVMFSWEALGIGTGQPAQDLDALAGFPTTTAAYTAQIPATGCPNFGPGSQEHGSMADDRCMPAAVAGGPVAASPETAYLFEPYLQRFCLACDDPTCL